MNVSKYANKSTAYLKKKAQEVFNKWIRLRDAEQPCISCGSWNTAHASHYFSAGKHNHLRFDEDNVWLSCIYCNTFEHGNLINYRHGLIKRIGIERVEVLELKAKMKHSTKDDRFLYLDILNRYSKPPKQN